MKKRYLYGAGGHAKVLLDIATRQNLSVDGFYDDDSFLWEKTFNGLPVLGGKEHVEKETDFLVAIGQNHIRQKIVEYLESFSISFYSLVHPDSVMSSTVKVGVGTAIMAGVVINADSEIGNHCIINTRSSVDHDCKVDDFVHVAPGSVLCGGVEIGEGSLIGAGAIILPEIKIGKSCTIGAGSVVLSDVPDKAIVWGNPAKIQSSNL